MEPYRIVADMHCALGEGPIWSARDGAVYWVDILAPAVHRYSLATHRITSWRMPERIGWIVERGGEAGFVAGFQSGFYELTLNPVARRLIADPEPHLPGNRLNDAKVDRFGRIWAGTMDCEINQATGSLYRLDASLEVSLHDTGYLVTNGPAFGAQHECMYHNDTGRRLVYRFELSSSGEPGERAEFLRFTEAEGAPDGMTVDSNGGVWIAHWGGGCLSRYMPDGSLDRRIKLPVSQITSCVFGGANLERLFVTSAAIDKPSERHAGALFEVDPRGCTGLASLPFAG